jgi:predicted aspartyl protease
MIPVEIVINSVRAVTLKVPVITNGQVVKAVVDTGAEVTVMSEATYFCIPEERRHISYIFSFLL